MASVSVGAAVRASFGFLETAWTRAWGIMALMVSLGAVIQGVSRSRPGMWQVTLSADAVLFVLATAAIGACYRIGLGPDHGGDPAFKVGPAGFNWGGLEWRVMGANIVVAVTFVILAVFALFIWAIAFGVSAATQGADAKNLGSAPPGSPEQLQAFLHIMEGPAGIVTVLIAIPLVAGLALLGAKMALFPITAADTGAFNFGHAWSLTRGALTALIVTTIAVFAVEIVVGMVAGFFAGVVAGLFRQGVQGGRFWGAVAGQAVGGAINAPLFSGLQIYVYRAQWGGDNVAHTFA